MKAKRSSLLKTLKTFLNSDPQAVDAGTPSMAEFVRIGSTLRQGLQGRNYEFDQVQEEVASEQHGAIWLVGTSASHLQQMFALLCQQPATLNLQSATPHFEGLFTLLLLPKAVRRTGETIEMGKQNETPVQGRLDADSETFEMDEGFPGIQFAGEPWDDWRIEEVLSEASRADTLLYLWDAAAGWQAGDARWCARLRNLGATLIPVMLVSVTSVDGSDQGQLTQQMELAQRRLGIRPFLVNAGDVDIDHNEFPLPEGLLSLLDHLLGLRPRLAIPLAQEIPGYRPHILRRILRQGAFFTALFGAEPVPLIDLPLQVAVSWWYISCFGVRHTCKMLSVYHCT